MTDFIQPRVLKGFRDYLPKAENARSSLIRKLESTFRSFGFVPIDTPALEYAEILLGKGGGETDKQVYRFNDNGNRDIALRFDLTVPFARFMAEHVDELYLPFRRFHIAKVWRGENTQRGRYREFMQCDFDIVGTDCASADSDIVLTIVHAMKNLGAGSFKVRINHRMVFNRFLSAQGIEEKSVAVLRIVDKLEKIGNDATQSLLISEIGEQAATNVLEFVQASGSFFETLDRMADFCLKSDKIAESAIMRLKEVYTIAETVGVSEYIALDPSITRGLDYYTGIVFETTLSDIPQIGSVCSGGRYNELASLYTAKNLPGVGASIGLDRLLSAFEIIGKDTATEFSQPILILNSGLDTLSSVHGIAEKLRAYGIPAEVYPESKKLSAQYSYAEKKGIRYAIPIDSESLDRGTFPLRDLPLRITTTFGSLPELVDFIAKKGTVE
jgi:histidyl-tRNA synthetase